MRVVVIGAHGPTGRLVVSRLLRAGHEVVGTVRSANQVEALTSSGARAAVVDLQTATSVELLPLLSGAVAVVYAAGSTGGDSAAVVRALDRDAIIATADAAVEAHLDRMVVISAHRTDNDFGPEPTRVLLRAKRAADAYVRASPLGWTIVRPDALTDGAPQGRVMLASAVPHGSITRADVAEVIVELLANDLARQRQFEVVASAHSIKEALRQLHEN